MGVNKIWFFLAGTALFIFAMALVEEALKNLAGRSFKKFLQKQTENKFKSLFGGAVVTAVLQSSSVVLLMVLSFVGAGIISMRNALAITLGSNLGSTFAGWLFAGLGFKSGFSNLSYILLSISILGLFFRSNKNLKNIFRFLIGFSLLFIGLDMMKESAGTLVDQFDLKQYADLSPYLFIPIGIVVTFLIQSSSATMAITLTALHNSAMPFESAAAVIIGAELGTTLKLMIGSIGGSADKKRVALGNVLYNLVMVIIITGFLHLLVKLIKDQIGIADDLLALVFFQSFINIAGIIIFFPLLGLMGRMLEHTFKSKKVEVSLKFIKSIPSGFPDDSLIMAENEILRLLRHTIEFNLHTIHANKVDNNEMEGVFVQYLKNVFNPYEPEMAYRHLKMLQGEIIEFLSDMPEEEMSKVELAKSTILLTASLNVIHAAKNIKDISHNLQELDGSTNETLNDLYLSIVKEEKIFYLSIQSEIDKSDGSSLSSLLEDMMDHNKKWNQANIQKALQCIKTSQISELEASSLLNVYRELYSSNKALIEVLLNLRVK